MAKTIQIRSGILAVAIMLSCNVMSRAQEAKTATAASASKSQQKYPAAAELKNFKADAANPELSDLRVSLLKAKAELESGQMKNSMSPEQIVALTKRINLLENKIKASAASGQKTQDLNSVAVYKGYLQSKQLSRAGFMVLDEAQQKEVMNSFNESTVTDLVNATTNDYRHARDNVFYIPVAEFNGVDISKQIHMLNNPSTYIVVKDASSIPVRSSLQETSAAIKYKMSRAEFNTFSPQKKRDIENSNHIEIID